SLGLLSWVDDGAYRLFGPGGLAVVAAVRLTSLAVCLALLLAIGGAAALRFALPRDQRRFVLIASMLWLIPTAWFVLVARVWVPRLEGWVDYVAFLGTGLLAEELLFRGALYELADRVAPLRDSSRLPAAVLIS